MPDWQGFCGGYFLRDKSGVDVLLERSSAFVLLAVLLVIAGCVLFVVGIRNRAGQKKNNKRNRKIQRNPHSAGKREGSDRTAGAEW